MTLVESTTGEVVVLMDKAAAIKITSEIKSWAGTLWLKIEEAHRGQAWRALGYSSWESYLDAEFDIGRSRGYQLVTHARAVRALAEAAGVEVSTMVDTPERRIRSIDVEAVASEIAEQAAGTQDERVDLVKRTVTEHYEATKTSAAAAVQEPTDPETDVEGEGEPETVTPPAEPAGAAPIAPADPPMTPEAELAAYIDAALGAELQVRRGLLTFDPARLMSDTRRPSEWVDLAADLRQWADAIDAARPRHLEAVR